MALAMVWMNVLLRVFKKWRWTEVNKGTYEGYKTHFDYADVARDKQPAPVREYLDMSDPDLECAIVDRWLFPEPVAFRSEAFVLQVEGAASIMVGNPVCGFTQESGNCHTKP